MKIHDGSFIMPPGTAASSSRHPASAGMFCDDFRV